MNNDTEKNNMDQFLDPKDLAAAFEHTMNFVKGDTEALPDMMQHSGRLLLKLSRRLSTTQMVLLVGALTLGAIFVAKRVEEALDDDDDNTLQKALGGSNRGGGSSAQASAGKGGSASDNAGSQSSKSGSSANAGSSDSDKKGSTKQSGTK